MDALGLSSGSSSAELPWVCKKGNQNGASVSIPSYFVWPLLVISQMYNGRMWYECVATVPKSTAYNDYLDSFYEHGLSFAISIKSTTSSVSWSGGDMDAELTYIWAFSSQYHDYISLQ